MLPFAARGASWQQGSRLRLLQVLQVPTWHFVHKLLETSWCCSGIGAAGLVFCNTRQFVRALPEFTHQPEQLRDPRTIAAVLMSNL